MGGIVGGGKNTELKQAQNNLHYIVSYYFTQEKIPKKAKNPFVMCQQVQEDKKIKNFPLVSFKFSKNNLNYTKYEYSQFKILQMIMLSPGIFVSLTEEGLQIWNDNNNGIQKITVQFFDKIKNNNSEISNCSIEKFDSDLFFLTFTVNQKQNSSVNSSHSSNYNKKKDLQGPQFVLFSVSKIIKEGKIIELFSINRIEFAFPISSSQVFTLNKEEIKILDFRDKKLFKIDKNLDLLKFPINYSCYLINDLVLISSKNKKLSIIYSTNKLNTIYDINDYIEVAFNIGNDKIILIGKKIKEILYFPNMHILSLNQYETDIFGSFDTKSFYPINSNSFLFINHKNRKLKEVFLNEYNELIIKKEILCPLNTLKFCPFIYTPPVEMGGGDKDCSYLMCALFICKEQTYFLKDENLSELYISENEPNFYSSTKRLFLSFFENKYIEIIKPIEGIIDPTNTKIIKKEMKNIYLPFIIFSTSGESTLNIALMKNKNLTELESNCEIFNQNIKTEIITKNNNKEIYIISIIKNSLIYIVKINDIIKDKKEYFNFGNNVKNIGILNLDNYLAFIFFDKKAIIINVANSFENKINPFDTFLFPLDIIYAYNYDNNIILVTKDKAFVFDYNSKKIEKEMSLDFEVSLKDNEINILQVQDNIYIFINGIKYFLFDIDKFEIINDIEENNLENRYFLFFNKTPKKFEVIKKDLINDNDIEIYTEEIYDNRQKMKYLENGKIFVGCYPNKFFIFENK